MKTRKSLLTLVALCLWIPSLQAMPQDIKVTIENLAPTEGVRLNRIQTINT